MPDWVADKKKRIETIRVAKAALEAQAKAAAEEERRIEAEKQSQREAAGRKKPGKPRRRLRTNQTRRRNATSPIPKAVS